MIYHGDTPVKEIIIHCSATKPEWLATKPLATKIAEIKRWHTQDRGWRDIGYHVVIDRDGAVGPGRPENVVGAHVRGKNKGSLGVCLIGGHGSSADDDFLDNFTPEQRQATWKVIRDIAKRTDIQRVSGHNQFAGKACPGFRADREFPWPPQEPKKSIVQLFFELLTGFFRKEKR